MVIRVKTKDSESPDRHVADDIRFKTDDIMVVVRNLAAPESEENDMIAVREYNWDHVVWYDEE